MTRSPETGDCSRLSRPPRGLTLLETLVALALLGLIVVVVLSIHAVGRSAHEKTEASTEAFRRAALLQDRMRMELRGARIDIPRLLYESHLAQPSLPADSADYLDYYPPLRDPATGSPLVDPSGVLQVALEPARLAREPGGKVVRIDPDGTQHALGPGGLGPGGELQFSFEPIASLYSPDPDGFEDRIHVHVTASVVDAGQRKARESTFSLELVLLLTNQR